MPRALLLAAGNGQRLRPLTDRTPKCLLPILGRPLLDYWVDELVACGVAEARVNTHAHRSQMTSFIERINRRGGLRLSESHEPELLGSAGAMSANADLADRTDAVLIIYADNFSTVRLEQLLAFHRCHGDGFTMLLYRPDEPRQCGIAVLNGDDRITAFVEKPVEPPGEWANAGVYVLSPDLYRQVARMGAFDIGFDVLPRLVGEMRGLRAAGYHRDIGSLPAYERACTDAAAVLPAAGYFSDSMRRAVFLDRDGTLLEYVPYLSDPAQVRLAAGAVAAVRRLRARGFACVVVTNQAQIGRGLLSLERLTAIHEEMRRQLAAAGVVLDGLYFCPVAPTSSDRAQINHPDRKPGPGMLIQAARDLHLRLDASWIVGDMVSDVLAGRNAHCRGEILLTGGHPLTAADLEAVGPVRTAPDLATAGDLILEEC
ncbi:MAG TPA: HAD-IIIA family hydrolase [Gemmataceae bacterium]|jgi:histidinol-phosphate phosphatase family protein|nr:HAD-IIIA family hydrolase [Gemmataceae bacterium]